MSPKDFRQIYHQELELSLYLCNFSEEVSKLTDLQMNKKFRTIWKYCIKVPRMCLRNFRKISDAELELSIFV